jgi:hypothetical protein
MEDFPTMCRDIMRDMGVRIIEPGPLPSYLPSHEWLEDSCMGADDEVHTMYIFIIAALKPGTGAFRRLIDRLRADGWNVAVIEPLGDMPAICRHMGFISGRLGTLDIAVIDAKPREQ